MFFHIPGFVRLWNRSIHASAGTRIIENKSVDNIPTTSVSPTERIGAMFTMVGAIKMENPIMVVKAEKENSNAR